MLITQAEECGCTRCTHCFFLSFCPLICELQVQGGQTPPCHPHLGPFWTNWEEKPFVLCFVVWFQTNEKGSLLLVVHVGAGLNQQEGKPFPLCFIGLLRRGNPSCHPYLFRLVWTNGEGFPFLLGFWGHFEQRRGNPSCCLCFEPTGCVLLGHFGMPTIYFFFFPANYNLRAKCLCFEPTGCILLGHFGMPTIYFLFFFLLTTTWKPNHGCMRGWVLPRVFICSCGYGCWQVKVQVMPKTPCGYPVPCLIHQGHHLLQPSKTSVHIHFQASVSSYSKHCHCHSSNRLPQIVFSTLALCRGGVFLPNDRSMYSNHPFYATDFFLGIPPSDFQPTT